MLVPINPFQHFSAHSGIARSFPDIYSGLHQPSRAGMPHDVGDDVGGQPGIPSRAFPPGADFPGDRLAAVMHDVGDFLFRIETVPALHVGEQPFLNPDRWPTLLRLALMRSAPVDYSSPDIRPAF